MTFELSRKLEMMSVRARCTAARRRVHVRVRAAILEKSCELHWIKNGPYTFCVLTHFENVYIQFQGRIVYLWILHWKTVCIQSQDRIVFAYFQFQRALYFRRTDDFSRKTVQFFKKTSAFSLRTVYFQSGPYNFSQDRIPSVRAV